MFKKIKPIENFGRLWSKHRHKVTAYLSDKQYVETCKCGYHYTCERN